MLRIILEDSTTIEDVMALSSALLWDFEDSYSDKNTDEWDFISNDGDCLIKFVIDKYVGAKYLIVSSENEDEGSVEDQRAAEKRVVEEVLGLAGAVTVQSWETLRNAFQQAKTDAGKAHAAIRLALDSVNFDAERMKFLTNQLMQDDPPVAESVIVGVGYMGWPQWKPVLEEFAANTRHPDLKRKAERMLSGFDQQT